MELDHQCPRCHHVWGSFRVGGVAKVAWDVGLVLQVRSWRAGLLLAVIPMDPGVPLHLGLPLILKASVSAQLEQAMRESSPTEEI